MDNRVVITGVGVISPVGIGKDKYWNSLVAGISGVRKIELPNMEHQCRTHIAAPVEDFDASEFLPVNKKMKYLGRTTLFALAATRLALEDAGVALSQDNGTMTIEGIDPYKVGIIIGTATGNMEILEREYRFLAGNNGTARISPHSLPHYLMSATSASIAIMYGCRGINYVVSTSCTAASQAIGNSFHRLKNGSEDIIVTGGADAGINPTVFSGFSALRAMSTRNEEPRKASRPFDKERDGFVMGEGAGIIILEKLDHAIKRKAPIYAEVKGFGMKSDSFNLTAPDHEAWSFIRAIKDALQEAGLEPGEIDYINAHGTSTRLNDSVETRGLRGAFGKGIYDIPISSTKSMIGHLLGAAGAVELIATALSIRDGVVHPTINYEVPDPECDLDYTPNMMREIPVKNAMSTSLGFGGFNSVLIIRRFEG